MYEGTIYVGGNVAAYGADAVEKAPTDQDREFLRSTLKEFDIDAAIAAQDNGQPD